SGRRRRTGKRTARSRSVSASGAGRDSVARGGAASRMAVCTTTCDDDVVPRTVLVVDDHPSFRATARALLEAEGFSVVGEAADGAEALAKTEELHPDLVLL